MKTILILGGSGFIGKALINEFRADYRIITTYFNNKPALTNKNIKCVKVDVISYESLWNGFCGEKIDVLINLVGQITNDVDYCKDVNLKGARNISRLINELNINKSIVISSYLVYGEHTNKVFTEKDNKNPKSIYANIKNQVEEIYLQNNVRTILLRSCNVYGIKQNAGLLSLLIKSYKNNDKITLPDNEKVRMYIYMNDFVKAVRKVTETNPVLNRIYNLGGEPITIQKIIKLFEKELNYTFEKEFKKINDEDRVVMDTSLFNDEFNFKPDTTFIEGINEVINYEKKELV